MLAHYEKKLEAVFGSDLFGFLVDQGENGASCGNRDVQLCASYFVAKVKVDGVIYFGFEDVEDSILQFDRVHQ